MHKLFPLLTRPGTRQAALAVAFGTALAAAGWAGVVVAQTALTPPAQRITDGALRADQRSYQQVQARIAALSAAGRPLRDYHLAKAQCWLDTSFHEHSRNDRGPWPQAALSESEALVRGMESRAASLPMETPLVAGAERLRPDLWQRAQALRGHGGWACAAAKAACAEVELVHAGHEHAQIGWRHAKPYVQIAEDLLADAEAQAAACTPPPPLPLPPAPARTVTPPPPPAPLPVVQAPPPPPSTAYAKRHAIVLFNFDRHEMADVTPGSIDALVRLVEFHRDAVVQRPVVTLSAHADRLNGTGQRSYNQRLSERRAEAVKQWLVSKGFDPASIFIEAHGDTRPTEACTSPGDDGRVRHCLLPNRRVEVTVEGEVRVRR